MKRTVLILIILITSLFLIALEPETASAQTNEESQIGITNPLPGDPIQGLVQITGFIDLEEWQSYDLEFGFTQQGVWFPIAMRNTEIEEGIFGEWDTSAITDGNYDLRLSVLLPDGTSLVLLTEGIRVRNYSAIETNTPAPTMAFAQQSQTTTPVPTSTPEIEATSTPVPLRPNPAEFTTPRLQNALIRGGIFGIILFAFLLFVFLRKHQNR